MSDSKGRMAGDAADVRGEEVRERVGRSQVAGAENAGLRAGESGKPTVGRLAVLTTGHSLVDDRVYFKEVRSLVAAFGQVDYLAPAGGGSPDSLVPGVTVHFLGAGSGLLMRLTRVPRALAWILRNRPRSVHFHDPECLLLGPMLRLLGNTRLIYDCHEVYPETLLGSDRIPRWIRPLLARIADPLERALAQFVDAVIGPTPEVVERFLGAKAIKEVIYNFPPLDLFPHPSSRGPTSPDSQILLYQGAMGVDRGLFVMIEAMPFVLQKCPAARLRLIGPITNGNREKAYGLIRELSLEGAVEMLAPVRHTEIPDVIGRATVGLVPFLLTAKMVKSIPIKQFEYMACGIPVLATDVPSVARFVRGASSGLVVKPGDAEALANGAIALLQDEAGRREMGRSGRRWIEEEWNWGRMEERLRSVYERLKD